MSLLGAPEKEPVPYASRLNIALYDRGDEEPVIAVHLNDKPVHIPECGGHRCTMAQWKGLVG
jgi:hypothetical protein